MTVTELLKIWPDYTNAHPFKDGGAQLKAVATVRHFLDFSLPKVKSPWIFVGDNLPEPEEGIEYLCLDDEGVKWLCEYDYNQNDEAVFTVLGSEAQPERNSICYWMPIPQLNNAEKVL